MRVRACVCPGLATYVTDFVLSYHLVRTDPFHGHMLTICGAHQRLRPLMVASDDYGQPASESLTYGMQQVARVSPQDSHVRTCYGETIWK